MAISLTTVAGTIEFPNGATPPRSSIGFRLTNRAANGSNVFLGYSEFIIAANGSFSADVQTTNGMPEDTYYEVTVSYFDLTLGRQTTAGLGLVKIPATGTVNLDSILPVRVPSNSKNAYRVKRGDTISFGLVMLDQYNRPLNLAGYSISARMRQGDGPLQSFSVTRVSNPEGRFDLTISASSSALLPLGPHDFDIKFSDGVHVSRTLTGTIIIDPEVTP